MFEGCGSQKQDDPGLHQLDLALQERHAGGSLIVAGRAVLRGPALDDVQDEHVAVCVQADGGHDLVEKFSCPSDEGFPLQVFVFSGSFSDHHDFGLEVSPVHHDLGPGTGQGALLAFGFSQSFRESGIGILGEDVVGLDVKEVELHGDFLQIEGLALLPSFLLLKGNSTAQMSYEIFARLFGLGINGLGKAEIFLG